MKPTKPSASKAPSVFQNAVKNMRAQAVESIKRQALDKQGLTTLDLPKGLELFKMKKSLDLKIDILPVILKKDDPIEKIRKGSAYYRRRYGIHRNVGGGDKTRLCLKLTFGKPCPICEVWTELRKGKDRNDPLVRAVSASARDMYLVFDPEDKKVKLLDASVFGFGKYLDAEISARDATGTMDNWIADYTEDGGRLVLRTEEDKGGGFAFIKTARIDIVRRGVDLSKYLDPDFDFEKLFKVQTYDQLADEFNEIHDGSDEGESTEKEVMDDEDKKDDEDENKTSSDEDEESKEKEGTNEVIEIDDEIIESISTMDYSDLNDMAEYYRIGIPKDLQEQNPKNKKKLRSWLREELEQRKEALEKMGVKEPQSNEQDNECPAGGTFGEDCDTLPECNSCKKWDECSDAS